MKEQSLSDYLRYLSSKYIVYLVACVTLAVLGSLFSSVNYMTKEIIDSITNNPSQSTLYMVGVFVILSLLHHGSHFIQRLFDIKYKPVILSEVVHYMYHRTMKHSLHWFDSHL